MSFDNRYSTRKWLHFHCNERWRNRREFLKITFIWFILGFRTKRYKRRYFRKFLVSVRQKSYLSQEWLLGLLHVPPPLGGLLNSGSQAFQFNFTSSGAPNSARNCTKKCGKFFKWWKSFSCFYVLDLEWLLSHRLKGMTQFTSAAVLGLRHWGMSSIKRKIRARTVVQKCHRFKANIILLTTTYHSVHLVYFQT